MGVEEELMLVDVDTMELAPAAPDVLALTADPDSIKAEIRECMIEVSSQPHRNARALFDDLASLRGRVRRAARRQHCAIVGGGVHAFSRAETQSVTDTERYRRVAVESGVPARWSCVFGTHVHVALSSADKAIAVTEALLDDLPTLIALSASSPLWNGTDSGLASTRLALWAAVPHSGLPPSFSSFGEYQECLRVLHRSGAIEDASHVWWDVRSQDRLGTIEVRVLDGQPRLLDTVALAGLVQSLVRFHGRSWDAGRRMSPNRFVVAENRWQAVWHGMDACFARSDGSVVMGRAAVDELLERVEPDAECLGATWVLPHLAELADQGGPAARERDLLARTGDAVEVMRAMADITSDSASERAQMGEV